MANTKILIRPNRQRKDGTTEILIRLTHKGKTRYIGTGQYIQPEQFDTGTVVDHPNARIINIAVRNKANAIDQKIISLGNIKTMSMDILHNVLKSVSGNKADASFTSYMQRYIDGLKTQGRKSYAATFEQTNDILKEITQSEFVLYSEINVHFLKELERKLKATGKSNSTIALHMRNIRTVFNYTINQPAAPVTHNDYPFRAYKMPKPNVRHRNIDPADIRKLHDYTPKSPTEQRAVDLFFLSLYLIGINFKDLLHAQKTDVYKGRLIYDRAKTKKDYSVKIIPEAEAILKKYKGDKYLLRFIEDKQKAEPNPERKTDLYKDITDQTNKVLKRIAKNDQVKINPNLSTYYARHTWATTARAIGVPKDDIVTALGHGDNTVTDAYITIDLKPIDQANRRVIDHILYEK